jgi:seryl-tRNA synthetase
MAANVDAVLSELNKRKANLQKLGKALESDKDKARAVKLLDGVIAKLKPLATERKKVEKEIEDAKKLADDVRDFNDSAKSVTEDASKLVDVVGKLRGAGDTPQKDFSALWVELQKVNLNSLRLEMPGQ